MRIVLQASMADVFNHMRIVVQASMADVSITYENCSENILNLEGS